MSTCGATADALHSGSVQQAACKLPTASAPPRGRQAVPARLSLAGRGSCAGPRRPPAASRPQIQATKILPAGWLTRNERIACTVSASSGSPSTRTASGGAARRQPRRRARPARRRFSRARKAGQRPAVAPARYHGAAGAICAARQGACSATCVPEPSPADRKTDVAWRRARGPASRICASAAATSRVPARPAGSASCRAPAGRRARTRRRRPAGGRAPGPACRAAPSAVGGVARGRRRARRARALRAAAAPGRAPVAPRCRCRARTPAAAPARDPSRPAQQSAPRRSGPPSERRCWA